jgi:hypothetical protein
MKITSQQKELTIFVVNINVYMKTNKHGNNSNTLNTTPNFWC